MAQITSGQVLREARERKGFDLNTVARRLRIRPDILRAIEAGDFSVMPPRGYTRNMVNAYARLLGLNPTEIVNMYLDEAYANQVERARGTSNSRSFNMDRATRRTRARDVDVVSTNRSYESGRTSTIHGTGTQATRVLYDDGTRYSRDDYGVTRERAERPGRSERDFISHHSGYDATESSYIDNGTTRGRSRSIHVGETPMEYTASRIPSFLRSRMAIIIAAVIVALLIAGVAFAVTSGQKAKQEEDVSQLPVSGITDTTGDSGSSSAAKVEIAPTSARVIYSVPTGKDCYVETYLDGKKTEETLTGPVERSVEVTGVWTITTYDAEALELTVDGVPTKLEIDSQYNDMYAYTVDFPAILAEWNKTHGTSASAASATTQTGSTNQQGTVTTQSDGQTRQTYEQSVNYDESLEFYDEQSSDDEESDDEESDEEDEESDEEDEESDEDYDESDEDEESDEDYEDEESDEEESYDEESEDEEY